jgi:hypothetical protein
MLTSKSNLTTETDQAVATGIRRTINRFRENPFYYFTESDIHASLVKDILEGYSNIFYQPIQGTSLRLSLVHLEYPTNFSFTRKEALLGESITSTDSNRQRGNFDLAVLKANKFEAIVKDMSNSNKDEKQTNLIRLLKSIISKDIASNEELYQKLNEPIGELIDYAIEVKFFHFNNATREMFDQVKIDNFKLCKAIENKASIKPVNLIFCYYWNDSKDSNIAWKNSLESFRAGLIKGLILNGSTSQNNIPDELLNIFIEVIVDQTADKTTLKPAYYYKNSHADTPEWVSLITKGFEGNP